MLPLRDIDRPIRSQGAGQQGVVLCIALALLSGAMLWPRNVRSADSAQITLSKSEPQSLPADSRRGGDLYKASCIVCHGPRAEGGVGPKLAGNPVLANDQAFWKIVHEGRHVMPPLKGVVTDRQLNDIRAWLKTLR